MSSETVATAALATYDIYKAYVNPDASSKQLVRVSHIAVIGFGLLTPCIAVGFNHAGFSVNYLITAIGIFVDAAIVPMACAILWKDQSRTAVIICPLVGSTIAIIAWLTIAYTETGEVTIASTSTVYPLVAGNMISLCSPLILVPVVSLFQRQNFDWAALKQLKSDRGAALDEYEASSSPVIEGQPVIDSSTPAELVSSVDFTRQDEEARLLDAKLKRAGLQALGMAIVLCLAFLILWPIPMYGTGYGKSLSLSAYIGTSHMLFGCLLQISVLTCMLHSVFQKILHWLGCCSFSLRLFRRDYDYVHPHLGRSEGNRSILRVCVRLSKEGKKATTRNNVEGRRWHLGSSYIH